ncbi:DUF2202 domain-containing protein [Patescibacteria group bacterium]|nr:DUF2202 domain-containing protein [Patescibacteria group bacterium]
MKKDKLLIIVILIMMLLLASIVLVLKKGNELNDNMEIASNGEIAIMNTDGSDIVDVSDYIIPHNQIADLPIENLSTEERDSLIMMREEEKLAHDVYTTLYEKWGLNIFRNIAQSESTHTDSVRYLLERYDIEDPVKDDAVGVFTNPTFTELYNSLVAQGEESLASALIVGATIEDLDIKDLNELSQIVNNADILEIYNNLNRGSRNHLRSFSRQLDRQGVRYSAQYLSQAEVDVILGSGQEQGF